VLATNSTIEILLIDSDRNNSKQIEDSLSSIESYKLLLTKIENFDDINNYICQCNFDLVFYFLARQAEPLLAVARIRQIIADRLPIIFFAEDSPQKRRLHTHNLDDCLSLSEISPALLEKSICLALERTMYVRATKFIQLENAELSSQLLATKNLFQTIVDNSSTLVWMCDAAGKTIYFNQAWSRILGQPKKTT